MNPDISRIASAYGIGVGAVRDAWNKSQDPDPEVRVKLFKSYLTQLTGVSTPAIEGGLTESFNVSPMPSDDQEKLAMILMMEELSDLEKMVSQY